MSPPDKTRNPCPLKIAKNCVLREWYETIGDSTLLFINKKTDSAVTPLAAPQFANSQASRSSPCAFCDRYFLPKLRRNFSPSDCFLRLPCTITAMSLQKDF